MSHFTWAKTWRLENAWIFCTIPIRTAKLMFIATFYSWNTKILTSRNHLCLKVVIGNRIHLSLSPRKSSDDAACSSIYFVVMKVSYKLKDNILEFMYFCLIELSGDPKNVFASFLKTRSIWILHLKYIGRNSLVFNFELRTLILKLFISWGGSP